MFCKNCGNELADGSIFCPKCGYRNDLGNDISNAVPEQQPAFQEQPFQPEPSMQQSWDQSSQMPPYPSAPDPAFYREPPKKRKKAPFIIGGVAAAAAVIGGVCIVNAASISNFIGRTFTSPEKYYRQVEEDAIAAGAGTLGSSYDQYLERLETIKASGNQNVDLTLRLEDGGRSLLGTVAPIDLSWLDEVSMKVNAFAGDSTVEGALELYLNERILGSFLVAGDWDLQEVYMKIPELSTAYLGVDLSQFESEYGIDFPASDEFSQIYPNLATICPDGETLEKIISRYYAPFLDNVTEVTKAKEDVTVGAISQKATVLEAEIVTKDLYRTAYQILEQLKNDPDVQRLIREFVDMTRAVDTYDEVPDADTVYQEFLTAIQDAEDSLHEEETYGSSKPFLLNKIWVDYSGQIIGREITVGESGESLQLFSYLRAQDGQNFEAEASIFAGESTVALTEKGAVSNDRTTSTCTVSVDAAPILTIDIENIDEAKAKEGYLNGSMTLHPESGFAPFLDLDESGALLTNYSLKMTFDQSKENSAVDFTVLSANVPMFTLSTKTVLGGTSRAAMPASEDKVYNAASEDDLLTYLSEVDWDGFLTNLKASDIPSEYLDALENGIMELRETLDYYMNY